ncbi:hypothetical protein [Aliarcobacter lanthieri]|uniref:hypothetical protein n=1 Tax=Aliarcobacter lanthieri TaxID=1355374 RepID=UPI003AAFFDC0
MILIQQFTKLPVFRQLSQKELKKVKKEENENELTVGDRKFIKQNTFKNFLKFRTKVLIGVSFVLLFVTYSMLNLNFTTNSWLKNNGFFTLFFCGLYVWLFWFYLNNLYLKKKSKLVNYLMFSGVIYIAISSVFQFNVLQGFLSAGRDGGLNQLILYNYFYIFLFNTAFYFIVDIFDADFAKIKNKSMDYYTSVDNNLLMVVEK